jgi:hypothetical protein
MFASASRPDLQLTQSSDQWLPGTQRPERESNYSPTSSTKVNNAWSFTYTPPKRLHGVMLKHRKFCNVSSHLQIWDSKHLDVMKLREIN